MKFIFTISHLCFLSVMAYFSVEMIYQNLIPYVLTDKTMETVPVAKENGPLQKALSSDRKTGGQDAVLSIIQRNLFEVDLAEITSPTGDENQDVDPVKIEPTTLKLTLWGTVTGEEVYAVIEDKKSRQQFLYMEGDAVQAATIKKIGKQRVILTFQGKDQMLEMHEDYAGKSTGPRSWKIYPSSAEQSPHFYRPASAPNPELQQEIKFKPHTSDGEPDGLIVYGLKSGSIFKKIGLRNGDILMEINESQIQSTDDVSQLLDSDMLEAAKLTILRRGKITELNYPQEEPDEDLEGDVPEQGEKGDDE